MAKWLQNKRNKAERNLESRVRKRDGRDRSDKFMWKGVYVRLNWKAGINRLEAYFSDEHPPQVSQ